VRPPHTPSQTVGPFFAFALPFRDGPWAVPEGTPGEIRVEGRLLDGRGDPVSDGLVETWQVGPPASRGFGRCPTDHEGRWAIVTLKPPPVLAADGVLHAPHLAVAVFARGLLRRVATRLYFADEAALNAADHGLAAVADPAARATLIAARTEVGYRLDIRLQGDGETVFFDV